MRLTVGGVKHHLPRDHLHSHLRCRRRTFARVQTIDEVVDVLSDRVNVQRALAGARLHRTVVVQMGEVLRHLVDDVKFIGDVQLKGVVETAHDLLSERSPRAAQLASVIAVIVTGWQEMVEAFEFQRVEVRLSEQFRLSEIVFEHRRAGLIVHAHVDEVAHA